MADHMIVSRIAAVVDMDPIRMGDGSLPAMRFRIEVHEDWPGKGRYRARVFRFESFRVHPSFPRKGTKRAMSGSDEDILVEDVFVDWASMTGSSPDEVLEKVVAHIRERLAL